jgi:uncharacterized protein (TIGR02145 family)
VKSIYDAENNTLTDLRDNKVYKTVTIGEQIWMAENLNYKYEAGSKSFCYNDSTKYCNLYGRLYLNDAKDVVCPDKWHLPDSLEWIVLIQEADGKNGPLKTESSWEDMTVYGHPESKGTNETGFSAYGGGFRGVNQYTSMGVTAAFLIKKSTKRTFQIGVYNTNSPSFVSISKIDHQAYSVRCIKDSE